MCIRQLFTMILLVVICFLIVLNLSVLFLQSAYNCFLLLKKNICVIFFIKLCANFCVLWLCRKGMYFERGEKETKKFLMCLLLIFEFFVYIYVVF